MDSCQTPQNSFTSIVCFELLKCEHTYWPFHQLCYSEGCKVLKAFSATCEHTVPVAE